MTKVLLLVHGMGVHDDAWAGNAIGVLREAAESYGLGPLNSDIAPGQVAVVPISYDDRFAAWVERWGNDSRQLASFIKTSSIDVPVNIVSWLESADQTENNFLWSHVVDVLLYRFFNEITKDVRVHVMQRVTEIWTHALDVDPSARVSVLAHSLGTSVTHDSLGLLATNPPEGADAFLAGNRRLASLFMLANVSRILETLPRVYESVICPPAAQGSKAYCSVFFNVRHELDPFPAPRRFKPVWTPGGDYVEIRTTAVREFNVHSLERYLEDPRVHIPILRSLFGFSKISEQTAAERIAEYDVQPGPPCEQALSEFITSCRERVRLIEDSSDIKTLLTAGVQFLADVERVRDKCAVA
jgi:hypothetical protein